MEKLDIIWRIAELIIAIVGASIITRILTIRERVRQEKANTAKMDAEAKTDQIDNIRKTMEEVYKPIIDDLKRQVNELRDEVREVREENERLKDENDQLRDAIRELDPNLVPSKRSVNASRQAAEQPRASNGRFVKKEEE